MATENFLSDFPPVPTQAWEEAIRADLKGADYGKKLLWKPEDGVAVKPYYRAEDMQGLPHLHAPPGSFPYVRSHREKAGWGICEEIRATSCAEANHLAQAAIAAGAEEIAFVTIPLESKSELKTLLANLGSVPVHFRGTGQATLKLLLETAKPEVKTADWRPSENFDYASEVVKSLSSDLRPFAMDATQFEGATTIQEVGYCIAAAIDFLSEMQTRGQDLSRAAAALFFSVSIGPNYFFQIAKLRALRVLWALAVTSFGGSKTSAKAVIHARTSFWNKTIYDPHVNALRATTEAMSGALGGADLITVTPFDEPYKASDSSSRRLARNTHIILKAEAYLDRVADAGGGSYYIEALTDLICRKSWETVQKIEAAGGFHNSSAMIQAELDKSRETSTAAVASRQRILVGTNWYPNLHEKALDRLKSPSKKTIRRGAEEVEDIRLRTERSCAAGKKCPRFLLAAIGDPKMSAARASFAANFFGCAGFEIVTRRFADVQDMINAEADVIVLCSSDNEYIPLTERLITALKALHPPPLLVIAGSPANKDQLELLGVAGFVDLRSNLVEILHQWQKRLGVSEFPAEE